MIQRGSHDPKDLHDCDDGYQWELTACSHKDSQLWGQASSSWTTALSTPNCFQTIRKESRFAVSNVLRCVTVTRQRVSDTVTINSYSTPGREVPPTCPDWGPVQLMLTRLFQYSPWASTKGSGRRSPLRWSAHWGGCWQTTPERSLARASPPAGPLGAYLEEIK